MSKYRYYIVTDDMEVFKTNDEATATEWADSEASYVIDTETDKLLLAEGDNLDIKVTGAV